MNFFTSTLKHQNQKKQNYQIIKQPNKSNTSSLISQKTQKSQSRFIRKFWTKQQDQKLIQLVQHYGNKRWTFISSRIQGRSPKRCRERWMNYLDTKKNNANQWNLDDQWKFYLLFQLHGKKWIKISQLMGRGDNHIKNQYHLLKRKNFYPFKTRLNKVLNTIGEYLQYQDPYREIILQIYKKSTKNKQQVKKLETTHSKQQQKILQLNSQDKNNQFITNQQQVNQSYACYNWQLIYSQLNIYLYYNWYTNSYCFYFNCQNNCNQ